MPGGNNVKPAVVIGPPPPPPKFDVTSTMEHDSPRPEQASSIVKVEHDPEYTIILRGEEFILTKSQIEFDAPNYFTSCFLGDFHEADTRRLKLSRDPDLFRLIANYLCGYTILPLNSNFLPTLMSPATVMLNLRADAAFYQLENLVKACDALIKPKEVTPPAEARYIIMGSLYRHGRSDDIDTQMSKASEGKRWDTYGTQSRLQEPPLNAMETPESSGGFEALRTIAAIERFARIRLLALEAYDWKLVGWNISKETDDRGVTSQLMVVFKQP